MISFIVVLALTIIGIVLLNQHNIIAENLGLFFAVVDGLIAIVMIIIIIFAHIGVDAQIEENRIEYNALCQRHEIITSEYEDVSKSDVIKDIAEWNKKVYRSKHWAYNPWTNWFYSKQVADDLKMIKEKEEWVNIS